MYDTKNTYAHTHTHAQAPFRVQGLENMHVDEFGCRRRHLPVSQFLPPVPALHT